VTVDFQGLVKSAALGWLSRAPGRYGFDGAAIREKAALLFTNRRIRVDTTQHVVDQNLALATGVLRALGVISSDRSEAEGVERSGRVGEISRFPLNTGLDPFAGAVVLLPGAGKASKLWPVERFRALAARIGPDALAVWGPGERERAEAIGARVAPPTNLRELAWILSRAKLVIGGDTGPLHLAAALGVPVVGLYGPTDPRRNGPYGQLHRCVDHFRSTKLMESITVEEVVNVTGKGSA
jgi:heptosyltransferase-1